MATTGAHLYAVMSGDLGEGGGIVSLHTDPVQAERAFLEEVDRKSAQAIGGGTVRFDRTAIGPRLRRAVIDDGDWISLERHADGQGADRAEQPTATERALNDRFVVASSERDALTRVLEDIDGAPDVIGAGPVHDTAAQAAACARLTRSGALRVFRVHTAEVTTF